MSFEFDTSGLDNLQKKLKKLDDNKSIPFDDLFPNSFMVKYTNFPNIDTFLNKSEFDWNNMDDIPEEKLDLFVRKNTSFSNWEDMKTKAGKLWTVNHLGL